MNDLVLVVDNTVPRSRWLLGRVARVFPGEDLCVRTYNRSEDEKLETCSACGKVVPSRGSNVMNRGKM